MQTHYTYPSLAENIAAPKKKKVVAKDDSHQQSNYQPNIQVDVSTAINGEGKAAAQRIPRINELPTAKPTNSMK